MRAEAELNAWRGALGEGAEVSLAVIDVIAEKPLARGLTAELGIRHESPQVLVFRAGELSGHASHSTLTAEWFAERVSEDTGP